MTRRLLLLMILLVLPATASAKDAVKVSLLVRSPQHITAAIETAKDMRDDKGLQASTFEIVVCGKAVKALGDGGELEEALKKALAEKVTIKACGMSLKRHNIDHESLIKGVVVVPNGIVELLERQAEGYLTVEL